MQMKRAQKTDKHRHIPKQINMHAYAYEHARIRINMQRMHLSVEADKRGEVGSLQVVDGADKEVAEDRQTQTDNKQIDMHAHA